MNGPLIASYVCFCVALSQSTYAQEAPVSKEGSSISPDKRWEYKCDSYYGGCLPGLSKAGETEVAVDLEDELGTYGPEASTVRIFWAPDSSRFAFNYSGPHPHGTTSKSVAFYQLRGDKWLKLRDPEDVAVEFAKQHVFKKTHRPGVLITGEWTDSTTINLYAIWYAAPDSDQFKAGYALTLKFTENGSWHIAQQHQISEKEAKKLTGDE